MATTEQTTRRALWVPGWYELDQPLVAGENKRLWFYLTPPMDLATNLPEVESFDFVFFNQLSAAANCQVRVANVVSITHPQIGPLRQIDTDGLDYIFYPVEGESIVVNAEEEPGRVYDEGIEIQDWTVSVELSKVSGPLSDST